MAEGKLGDDDKLAQLQAGGDHVLAELSQVVLVGMADLSDQAVEAQAFEQTRDLAAVFIGQESAQGFVLHAADVELSTGNGAEQGVIVRVEEIEPSIGAAFALDRL